jgi:TonB-linked SusC/RagA family outer membrane protein
MTKKNEFLKKGRGLTCRTLLLIAFSLFLSMNLFSQVTIKVKNVTIKTALKEIEKSSQYKFFYSENMKGLSNKVSLNVTNQSIDNVMVKLLSNSDMSYRLQDGNIITIVPVTRAAKSTVSKQTRKYTGVVKDEKGEPAIGASIIVKGKKGVGTITDSEGRFSLDTNPGNTLVISYIGCDSKEVRLGAKENLNVILQENSVMMDEVVAIGYGSVRKSDLTGAVTNISSKLLQNQAKMNDPIQALQGQIAGADITSGNAPGTSSSIIIRGYNTLMRSGGDDPLIIVDDAPFLGSLNEINPSEIEKIDILKDASSTAIYGARGANGVIIITTKRGNKDGKLSVEYNGYFGMGKSYKNFDVMDGPTYAAYRKEAYMNAGSTDCYDDVQQRVIDNGSYVNWQKLMFNDWSYKTNHDITINTSTGKSRNAIMLGYNKDQGIIENMSYDRFSGRFTGDIDFNKHFTVGYSLSFVHSLRNLGEANVWRMGTRMDPLSEVYDENGNMNFYTNSDMQNYTLSNPIFDTSKDNVDSQVRSNNLSANAYFSWEIIKGLKFKSSLTFDATSTETGAYFSSTSTNRHLSVNAEKFNKATHEQYNFTNILNYVKNITADHKIDVSLVQDMQKYETNAVEVAGQDIPYYGMWYNVEDAQENIVPASNKLEYSLLSFMGRVNYTYKDRYLFTATGRYDGSSRLAKGHKWAFFPSAAVAWRITEEPFMKSVNWLTNLKLRISYGVSGNTAVAPYETQGAYSKMAYTFGTDEVAAWGYVPTVIANPDMGWERTGELNIGLDYGFLNNRISGSIDVYERNTYDLLMNRTLPTVTGYSSVWQNVGQIRNTGIELALQVIPVQTKDFSLTVKGTLSYNKNEIVKLFNGTDDYEANLWFIGQPVSVDRFAKYIGVWQTDEADQAALYKAVPGQAKLEDKNGDFVYDTNDMDIYNKIPKWLAGLSISAQYKNFDFSVYSYGRFDYGTRMGSLTYDQGSCRFNQIGVSDFWTADNPTNACPRPEIAAIGYESGSSWAWRDLSFVRIKNINLGYTLPAAIIGKIGGKSARIYIGVDNPFIFTKSAYKGIGLDPENCNSEASARPLTTYMVGVNVKF